MEQTTPAGDSLRERELVLAREVAYAFLNAATPLEVYRLALARVTPLVRADFSSVFLRDPDDPSLLRLTCAHNWPQASARYLNRMRVRIGLGPTGRAVAEQRAVEVADVFADETLADWWDAARELDFVSFISLPLSDGDGVGGALTFYFRSPHVADEDERHLLMLIADHVAVASGRAEATEVLRRDVERLRIDNERLRRENERLRAG